MTIEEAFESGKWNNIVDSIYNKFNDSIYNKILTEIENVIDNIILKEYNDGIQDWFVQYKLKPYLKERFPYHIDWSEYGK